MLDIHEREIGTPLARGYKGTEYHATRKVVLFSATPAKKEHAPLRTAVHRRRAWNERVTLKGLYVNGTVDDCRCARVRSRAKLYGTPRRDSSSMQSMGNATKSEDGHREGK